MTFNFIDASRCLSLLIIRLLPACSAPRCGMQTHTNTIIQTASLCELMFGSGTCQKVMMYITCSSAQTSWQKCVAIIMCLWQSVRDSAQVCVCVCNEAGYTSEPVLRDMLCSQLFVSSKSHSSVSQRQSNSVLTPQLHARLQRGQSI